MSYETLILPFQFEFMQNAFLIALIVSIPSALLSCFLVMKGWALMGDAVSHAVLPGIIFCIHSWSSTHYWSIYCGNGLCLSNRVFIK